MSAVRVDEKTEQRRGGKATCVARVLVVDGDVDGRTWKDYTAAVTSFG